MDERVDERDVHDRISRRPRANRRAMRVVPTGKCSCRGISEFHSTRSKGLEKRFEAI